MQERSELEQFLQSTSAEGQVESQGAFTLNADVALRKIAEYQLPFEGAWAVKIVQAIVAGMGTGEIRVALGATEVRFKFPQADFTLDEVADAFYNPEPSTNGSLRHLLSGLWAVGLKERWGFQIALPGQKETLIWDGGRLHRVHSRTARDGACISIAPLQDKDALSWVAGVAQSGGRNAEILLALSRRCYVCPLPLTVDGRRIDSLQRAEHHGWSSETYPLGIAYAGADIPALRLPPGTFLGVTKDAKFETRLTSLDGDGWRLLAEKRMGELSPRERAGVAFLWTIHMTLVRSGKSSEWKASTGASTLYWVLDGALVGEEPLLGAYSHCSVGCFANAQGLETDLSTFDLLDSPARTERVKLVREATLEGLGSVSGEGLDDLVKRGKLLQNIAGGVVVAFGVGFFWLSLPLGLVISAAGGVLLSRAGVQERARVRLVWESLNELRSRLCQELESC